MSKQILITGATNGIGLAAAEVLTARGWNVGIVGRDEARTRAVAARLKTSGKGGAVETFIADLSSQAAVRKLAAEVLDRFPKLDVLANNAGAMFSRLQLSVDGIELTWALNHLAPFLLTSLLLERLKNSAPARVITTASGAHNGARIPFDDLDAEHSYRAFGRYGETKLANVLFTSELARRLGGQRRHGGELSSGPGGEQLQSQQRNAGATRHGLAPAGVPQRRGRSGDAGVACYRRRTLSAAATTTTCSCGCRATEARDAEAARRLWEVSEAQCGNLAVGGV